MSKDTNRLLGHADEADGIEEYDNPLPDWWIGLFWLCTIWAIGYAVHYHFIGNRSQESAFAAEMAAASAMWPAESAADVVFALTPEAIQAGGGIFGTYCSACHGQNLEGFIGPSFLDDEWIHGSTPEDVIRTITEGVLEKGMTPWAGILTAEQISQAAAFVLASNAEALGIPLEEIGQASPDPEGEEGEHGEGVGEHREGGGGGEGSGG